MLSSWMAWPISFRPSIFPHLKVESSPLIFPSGKAFRSRSTIGPYSFDQGLIRGDRGFLVGDPRPGPADLLLVGVPEALQVADVRFQAELLPDLGVSEGGDHVLEAALRRVERIFERPVRDVPAHELVDELLLDEVALERSGIESVFDPIDQDFYFLVEVSWTPYPAVPLLQVHRPVGDVQVVGGHEAVLKVGPDPELLRGPHDDADIAVVYLVGEVLSRSFG